jgi:hypothetical protein
LQKAGDIFIETLDGYSLADLVKPRAPLQRLLAIPPVKSARARRAAVDAA